MTTPPLTGRTAVVTGVSRRRGIGFAVAARLADMGASLYLQHFAPHDDEQPWGAEDIDEVMDLLRARLQPGARLAHGEHDFAAPEAPDSLIRDAAAALGHLDILICNHARSGGDGRLQALDAAMLDTHWAVNARSVLLATARFADQHDGRTGGRVIWFTSGQLLGTMPDEIAYCTSKAALAGITPSVSADLADRGILLNTVNPGPVNTGYLDPATADRPLEVLDDVGSRFPGGHIGAPDDPARLIAWLVSDEGRWVVGQTISTEGGFRRG
ncbi:SDR family oxidoreductase [Arthrobacter sp. zg-Y1116]|uniref:SDR family oxidoreductase n=1 Tax=Arthrobacter sp. zg-Y1116 TaxID=2964611 RepID=UPI002104C2C6|nr:SDR family oxidoreductase [Arthrobacter sp. zg-Y1116]MCQ1946101.1 SDR family oxidoreductase [Arthrobacter sp. zg-Y1116]